MGVLIVASIIMQSLKAAPKHVNDPVFNQATIIGTVFLDENLNGMEKLEYQAYALQQ